MIAVAASAWALFWTAWFVVPPPEVTIYSLSILARELSLWLAAIATLGILGRQLALLAAYTAGGSAASSRRACRSEGR